MTSMRRALALAVIAGLLDSGAANRPRTSVKIVNGASSTPGAVPTGTPRPPPTLNRQPSEFAGPELLRALKGGCFYATFGIYEYGLCPFLNITQRDTTGAWNGFYGVLGVWDGWDTEVVASEGQAQGQGSGGPAAAPAAAAAAASPSATATASTNASPTPKAAGSGAARPSSATSSSPASAAVPSRYTTQRYTDGTECGAIKRSVKVSFTCPHPPDALPALRHMLLPADPATPAVSDPSPTAIPLVRVVKEVKEPVVCSYEILFALSEACVVDMTVGQEGTPPAEEAAAASASPTASASSASVESPSVSPSAVASATATSTGSAANMPTTTTAASSEPTITSTPSAAAAAASSSASTAAATPAAAAAVLQQRTLQRLIVTLQSQLAECTGHSAGAIAGAQTADDLQQQVETLLEQIEQCNAQKAAEPAPPSAQPTVSVLAQPAAEEPQTADQQLSSEMQTGQQEEDRGLLPDDTLSRIVHKLEALEAELTQLKQQQHNSPGEAEPLASASTAPAVAVAADSEWEAVEAQVAVDVIPSTPPVAEIEEAEEAAPAAPAAPAAIPDTDAAEVTPAATAGTSPSSSPGTGSSKSKSKGKGQR